MSARLSDGEHVLHQRLLDEPVAGTGVLRGDFARGLHYGAVCAALSLGQLGDLPSVDAGELERLVDAPGG